MSQTREWAFKRTDRRRPGNAHSRGLSSKNLILVAILSDQIIIYISFSSRTSFFFLSGFSFTDTDNSQDSRGREGNIFYSTLPLPPAHEHSDVYLQLCTWDEYHIFLIATPVFTRLLLDEMYHLIESLFDWLMM